MAKPVSEKAMATHSSTLAWKIPWTEEPRRLGNMKSVFAWRIPGMGSLVGCRLWGRTESGHDGSDLAATAASLFTVWPFTEKKKNC